MSQKTEKDYFGNWQFANAVTKPVPEDSQSANEPLDRIRLVPPDNFIPSVDVSGRINLPPPFEVNAQSKSDKPPAMTVEHVGSPSSTTSSSSPTPKLQIITDLRPGSFSISSQTPTPYSDTLLSVQDPTPSPSKHGKLVEETSPLPPNRRRSNSEPQQQYRPVLTRNHSSDHDQPAFPQPYQPQAISTLSALTPVTPMLSRSSSRKKTDAFVAHNPFVGHRHVHGAGKVDKQDLTFDDIQTPGPHSNPFGNNMFASDVEDIRGLRTPINTHEHTGDYQTLARSHSLRASQTTDTNRTAIHTRKPDNYVHVGEHRASTLIRASSHRRRMSQSRGHPGVKVHPAEPVQVAERLPAFENKQPQSAVTLPISPSPPLSSHPVTVDGDYSEVNERNVDEYQSPISGIYRRPSILRSGTSDSNLTYSKDDDPEKNSIDTVESSPRPTLLFRIARALGLRTLRWSSAPTRQPEESEKSLTTATATFIAATLPKQLYLHFLLRLPLLYFSRVSRIFEEADMTLPEIKRMALETPHSANKWRTIDLAVHDRSFIVPLEYQRLSSTWEFFIDSVLREWKIFNIISGLLLSAILTILQIDTAAQNPITRYTALFSLICSLISLLFGCMYIIRFGTMRKPYKAAEWALEARNKTMIWWNVWVLLAMPAIWLTWSIVLYIACIMAFAWQTTAQDDTPPPPLSPTTVLVVRVLLTGILGLGVVYGVLIVTTFSRYGEDMDKAWKERIDEWADEKAAAVSVSQLQTDQYTPSPTEDSSVSHWREGYTPSTNPTSPWRAPVSPRPPSSSHVGFDQDGYPHRVPESSVKDPGSNLENGESKTREKRRVRFQSPKKSPGEKIAVDPYFKVNDSQDEGSPEPEIEA